MARLTSRYEEELFYEQLANNDEAQAIKLWAQRNAPVHQGSRDLIKQFVLDTTRPIVTKRSVNWLTKLIAWL